MESEHFPIKVSEDIIRVYQNGPEHNDLEHGQNHYIKGHFFQLLTNFFQVHCGSNGKIFFSLIHEPKCYPQNQNCSRIENNYFPNLKTVWVVAR